MRPHVRAFVRIAAEVFDLQGPVYEFGSYLVTGQERDANLRELFAGREYVGCDNRPGPGVDRVEDLGQLRLKDGCARTVICVDTLEHVFEARKAMDEMIRVLAPGGMLLVAAPMDFRIHDHPDDYWRLTPSCLARLMAPLGATGIGSQGVQSFPHTVLGFGCKAPVRGDFARRAARFQEGFQSWLRSHQAAQPLYKRLKQRLTCFARSKGDRRRVAEYHVARFSVVIDNASFGNRLRAYPKTIAATA